MLRSLRICKDRYFWFCPCVLDCQMMSYPFFRWWIQPTNSRLFLWFGAVRSGCFLGSAAFLCPVICLYLKEILAKESVSPSSAHPQAHGHWSTVCRSFVLVSVSTLQTVNSGRSRSTTSLLLIASSILSNQGLILELCWQIHDNSRCLSGTGERLFIY